MTDPDGGSGAARPPEPGRWPPRTRPRRVENGLKARSTRGAIGKAWWSKRFLTVLESLAIGGRLGRGRAYARAGQVRWLRVDPGAVTASVQGSRREPYQVMIGLAPYPPRTWERVESALSAQAIYSAQLLAGQMPPDIEDLFRTAGAPLFPQQQDDLSMSCSCPDPVVPCKHLAASFYLLAEAFDDDPFQILHWRGRPRAELLDRLRALRAPGAADGSTAPVEDHAADAPVVGTAAALAELPRSWEDPLSPARFWLAPVPLPTRPSTLDAEPDLLLRQLPEPGPGLGGADLREVLRQAYQRFGAGGED